MPMSLFKNNKNRNKVVNPYCSLGYWSNMESFLVYLFNFYYAISELEQNKQNNTIIFFLLFIFLTKKWTSAVCGGGGVRAHPSHPPSLRAWTNYISKRVMKEFVVVARLFQINAPTS